MSRLVFLKWHAVLMLIIVNICSAFPVGFQGDQAFYNNFQLPRVAPPDWLFPPMWLFLNVTSMIALYRVANQPSSKALRITLRCEVVGWVLFAVFSTLYFWLQSPILGAVDTVIYEMLTIISISCCVRFDRVSAILIAPRLVWLSLASYVSTYGAMYNPDPLLKRFVGS